MNVIQIVVGAEILAAVIVAGLSIREFFYLRHLRRQAPHDEDLWLLDAVRRVSGYLTFTAIYLLLLTGLSAAGIQIATAVPEIRAVNGLVFLGVLAIPVYLGGQMRRRRSNGAGSHTK